MFFLTIFLLKNIEDPLEFISIFNFNVLDQWSSLEGVPRSWILSTTDHFSILKAFHLIFSRADLKSGCSSPLILRSREMSKARVSCLLFRRWNRFDNKKGNILRIDFAPTLDAHPENKRNVEMNRSKNRHLRNKGFNNEASPINQRNLESILERVPPNPRIYHHPFVPLTKGM